MIPISANPKDGTDTNISVSWRGGGRGRGEEGGEREREG